MAVRIAMGNMLVLRVIRCFFKGGGDGGRGRGVMVLMVGGSGGGDGVMVGG